MDDLDIEGRFDELFRRIGKIEYKQAVASEFRPIVARPAPATITAELIINLIFMAAMVWFAYKIYKERMRFGD